MISLVFRLSGVGILQRVGSATVIVVAMACVAGVLLSLLSLAAGIESTFQSGAYPGRAIVYSAKAQDEYESALSLDAVGTILNAPGIAIGSNGKQLVSAEFLQWLPPIEGFGEGSLYVRGVGTAGLAMRPGFKIVTGRVFRTGARELILGVGAESVFHLKLGEKLILPDGEWPIVGTFSAQGNVIESQLVGDTTTLMTAAHSSGFAGVLVALKSPDVFGKFKSWLVSNPTLSVNVERQSTYLTRTANRFTPFFTAIAYLVGSIVALGALFGSVEIMHSAVDARTREIAVLRAIGYSGLSLGASVILEAVALSLIGATLGSSIVSIVFNNVTKLSGNVVFKPHISMQLVAFAFAISAGLAVLGGLPPALRAVRLSVTDALREV